jgi:hypothetical protein
MELGQFEIIQLYKFCIYVEFIIWRSYSDKRRCLQISQYLEILQTQFSVPR